MLKDVGCVLGVDGGRIMVLLLKNVFVAYSVVRWLHPKLSGLSVECDVFNAIMSLIDRIGGVADSDLDEKLEFLGNPNPNVFGKNVTLEAKSEHLGASGASFCREEYMKELESLREENAHLSRENLELNKTMGKIGELERKLVELVEESKKYEATLANSTTLSNSSMCKDVAKRKREESVACVGGVEDCGNVRGSKYGRALLGDASVVGGSKYGRALLGDTSVVGGSKYGRALLGDTSVVGGSNMVGVAW